MAAVTATITSDTALAALFGVGVGLGLVLLTIGWRGPHPGRGRRHLCRRIGSATGHDRHWVARVAVAITVGVLAGVGTGWVVGAVVAGLGCWALPRVLARDPEHARQVARVEAIAGWTEMLRDILSAASGLEQAILATAPLAPAGIRGEIAELAARLHSGDRLVPSLRRLADRLADPTGDLVIAALALAAEQQARQLGDLLGALAHTAREQAAMRMRVDAGRARTQTSVRVIVGTTVAFAVGVVLLNRPYLSAYDSVTGQAVMAVIGVLFGVGFLWLARIGAVPAPPRLLDPAVGTTAAGSRLIAERPV